MLARVGCFVSAEPLGATFLPTATDVEEFVLGASGLTNL